ncbi:MAG: hypothetical protein KDB20_16425, partial [Microthrixaceae bacterium]|nr:hypothetical protein [Microthrixaceae bacterium]
MGTDCSDEFEAFMIPRVRLGWQVARPQRATPQWPLPQQPLFGLPYDSRELQLSFEVALVDHTRRRTLHLPE